jgi:CDP-diacylglycerol--glycerol-3-phosphate 3-phosphatidyltransferase
MLKINDGELGEQMQDVMRYVAIVIFFVMTGSDIYDGYIARRYKQVTKLGSFLDPLADKLMITCACLLLASERAGVGGFLLPPTVVVLIIGKDLFLLIGFVVVYFITEQVRIESERIGRFATFLQSSMVSGILLAPEISLIIGGWIWFLRVLWWSAAGTAILATFIYIRTGSRYIEAHEHGS